MWNNRLGIDMHDHAERHSAFNTSSKRILLVFDFYDTFPNNVMFVSILISNTTTKLTFKTKL